MPNAPKTRAAPKSWPELGFESWMLMGEASMVVWLRTLRLMAGGPIAAREANRMMAEKVTANLTLGAALAAGGMGQSPEALGAAALAHYGKPVRANRLRLERSASGTSARAR